MSKELVLPGPGNLDSRFHEGLGAKHLPKLWSLCVLTLEAVPDKGEEKGGVHFTEFLTQASLPRASL